MIKATSQSVCSGITGCQVEVLGSGAELLREYRGVTATMYRSLRGHMPEMMEDDTVDPEVLQDTLEAGQGFTQEVA